MFIGKNLGKVLLVLAVLSAVYFDEVWPPFDIVTDSFDQMEIRVEDDLFTQAPYHLFWFGQDDRTIKLHYNSLLGKQPLCIYALTKQESIVTVLPEQSRTAYRLAKDYSGTLAAMIPPVRVDLDNDGQPETIQLSAKIDTLFAQPFKPIRTSFADPRIPFEVCWKGHQDILLLFNNQPLRNQKLRLVSRRGYGCGVDRTVTTDADGMLQVKDVRDLRTGISLIYSAPAQTRYITSYRLEANSMFTPRYLRALAPLVKVLQWSVLLTLFLVACQKLYLRRARTVLPVKVAGDMSQMLNKLNVTKL
jgi:hypothetical protein